MRANVRYISFANLIFLLLLIGAGSASGVTAEFLMLCAYVLPCALVFFFARGCFKQPLEDLKLKKEGAFLTAVLIAPALAVIIGLFMLTALIMEGAGVQVERISTEPSFIYSLASLALVPAVLDELVFRYLPMKLLLPHSPRVCVLLSAAMFSAAHMSVQSFAYAFFAGVIFMTVNVISRSMLPSLIMHFMNNALSISLSYFGDALGFKIGFFVIFGLLLCCSLVVIALKRREIFLKIKGAFAKGNSGFFGLSPLAFLVPCVFIAIADLIG